MSAPFVFLLLLGMATAGQCASQTVNVSMEWTFDPKNGSWTSKDAGLVLRKSMAGFQLDRANPAEEDGSASFGYSGAHGIITVILEHRLAGGYLGVGDCTPAVRDNYLRVMHKSYGKSDSERSFRLRYVSSGKRGHGVGAVCHFLSFPDFSGEPAYSEVGAVLVGDFLIEYRGTFINKAGLADLNEFLAALGVKKA